jgi:hypothetical protein
MLASLAIRSALLVSVLGTGATRPARSQNVTRTAQATPPVKQDEELLPVMSPLGQQELCRDALFAPPAKGLPPLLAHTPWSAALRKAPLRGLGGLTPNAPLGLIVTAKTPFVLGTWPLALRAPWRGEVRVRLVGPMDDSGCVQAELEEEGGGLGQLVLAGPVFEVRTTIWKGERKVLTSTERHHRLELTPWSVSGAFGVRPRAQPPCIDDAEAVARIAYRDWLEVFDPKGAAKLRSPPSHRCSPQAY